MASLNKAPKQSMGAAGPNENTNEQMPVKYILIDNDNQDRQSIKFPFGNGFQDKELATTWLSKIDGKS